MSIIIRKRTLLVIVFALFLIVSLYMMYIGGFSKVVHENNFDPEDVAEVTIPVDSDSPVTKIVKGLESDFFIDYKLERDRLRSQEADYLKELINNLNVSTGSKEKAQQDLITLSQKVEKEMVVENLIKAKGFEDAVMFFSDEFVNIVVKTSGLLTKDIAQITDVVTKTTGISVDKIAIIERR